MATSKINVPSRSEIQVESPDEIHTSEECTYIKKKGRVPWWKDPLFVHIRKCRCKKGFKNREDLIHTHVTEITEFSDGVEIHQTETCGNRPFPKSKGQVHVKLRKTCKCPR